MPPVKYAFMIILPLLAGAAQAVVRYTAADNLAMGPGYIYNQFYFEGTPDQDLSLNVSLGRTRVTSPVTDTTNSLGFGGWIRATRKLDFTASFGTYKGQKSSVLRIPDMEYVREKSDRQVVRTVSGILGLDMIERDGDEGGSIFGMRLELGAISGKNAIPVWTERFAPLKGVWVEKKLKDYEIRDMAYSSGLILSLLETTLSATYRRHHYTQPLPPPGSNRPEISSIVDAITSSTVDGLPPFPRYESSVKLGQGLGESWAISVAYDYTLTDMTGEIIRYITGEMSWQALSWVELRGGAFWERSGGETTRYTTMGVSLSF